jgi:uncharacterized membrane protein
MSFNPFYHSNTIDNIRLNVIMLHALSLVIGGLYVIYAVLQHEDVAIRSQLFTGLITLGFGFFNLFAARLRSHIIISLSLVIWFVLLIYRSFNVIDPTGAAIGINMALLSLIVLVTIYYSSWAGFSILLLITAFNFYRWYALENGLIVLEVTENTGIFETNVLAILSLYSCTIAGYYQHQSQSFLDALELEKESLIKAIAELRSKEEAIVTIISEIQQLSDEKLPLIKPNIDNYIEKLNSGSEKDFNQFLNSGDQSMQFIDEILRSIDEQIKTYEQ